MLHAPSYCFPDKKRMLLDVGSFFETETAAVKLLLAISTTKTQTHNKLIEVK